MKKLNLITEFDEFYKGSDLQKIVKSNPLPIKYTIDGFDLYFYNADLFGLFEWNIKKDGLTTSDFIDDYKKGFEAGLLHLKTSEEIELKDLKSKDLIEGTISQLKYILHEREFKFGSKGLLDLVFNKLPLIFTEKNIFDYGYWNGIIYSIDKISEKAGLSPNELKTLPPQQTEKPKPELKLNEFFIKEVSSETIEAIQTEFKELDGKELAMLIYLLHKEHKIIEILTNSRTKGRKGFVKCLKEIDNPTMQKVNKCFTPNTDDLIYSKDDLVFQSLNKRLTETIKI